MTPKPTSHHRISVVGIGTELTSGQILNRNASWISAKLAKMGVQTAGHWVVPDDRELIREAFEISARSSDLIFVTGGLGPTTDDFTRDMIAEWAAQPLEWDEATWIHIRERLEARGIPARESQKQQCYYPHGSVILKNNQGTAHGFRIEARGKTLVILPGPPKEIEAIWNDHLAAWLPSQFPDLDAWMTRSWDTIGLPESTVAEMTEQALAGSGFEIGYRVHLPYVEVKASHRKSQSVAAAPFIARLDEVLSAVTALRDGHESSQLLAEQLKRFSRIEIQDAVSGEYLVTRLLPAATIVFRQQKFSFRTDLAENEDFETLVLTLSPNSSREAVAVLSWRGIKRRTLLSSPYVASLVERERHYFAELAMLFWARELSAI